MEGDTIAGESEALRDLYAAIESHPGMVARRAWDALRLVHVAFIRNQAELLGMIEAIESNRDDIDITMSGNMTPEDARQSLYAELFQLLDNYVASAVTLIDHTRNLTKGYEGTKTHAEYLERTAAIRAAGLGPFVAKLRVYVVHVGVPAIGTKVQIENDESITITSYIARDRALEWPDWPKDARQYLAAQPEHVSLRDLVTDDGSVIEDLYRWFYDRFPVLHADDIAAVNELISKTPGRGRRRESPPA